VAAVHDSVLKVYGCFWWSESFSELYIVKHCFFELVIILHSVAASVSKQTNAIRPPFCIKPVVSQLLQFNRNCVENCQWCNRVIANCRSTAELTEG